MYSDGYEAFCHDLIDAAIQGDNSQNYAAHECECAQAFATNNNKAAEE